MKKKLIYSHFTALFVLLSFGCFAQEVYRYKPDSKELYETMRRMDSLYWKAYNTCDMETQEKLYADSLEFYHDGGGFSNSKQGTLDAIKRNICGKVTRIEVPGTLEVYPIKGYGAVVMGVHRFLNKLEPNAPSRPGRYIVIWQQAGNSWQMKRVISLH